jgi:uncharacterized protein YjbJ (UPF0337 family)
MDKAKGKAKEAYGAAHGAEAKKAEAKSRLRRNAMSSGARTRMGWAASPAT